VDAAAAPRQCVSTRDILPEFKVPSDRTRQIFQVVLARRAIRKPARALNGVGPYLRYPRKTYSGSCYRFWGCSEFLTPGHEKSPAGEDGAADD
jgi:hypothetical protein